MYRKKLKIEKAEDLTIQLPDEYLNKEIEITANEIGKVADVDITDFSDAEVFFNRFSIDMSNFKFNRDEANQR